MSIIYSNKYANKYTIFFKKILIFDQTVIFPLSAAVAQNHHNAGDNPCRRHTYIVTAEADGGCGKRKGQRQTYAQIDKAGGGRQAHIARTLQKAAGDVHNGVDPDKAH